MLRRIVLSLSLAASSVVIAPASAAMAGPENDIPGIPLPGPDVTGELTGDVHDLVYRVELAKGTILVANLTGDAGTDFDLYLWPETATTVYAQSGFLVRSNEPGSREVLTWPAREDSVVYLDVTRYGAAGGTFNLTVAFSTDSTAPIALLQLNGGAAVSTSSTIVVIASGYDSVSGVQSVALSDDGVNFGPWQAAPYQTTWTFSPGDGVKTLWARAKNGVGTLSAPLAATVRVDTTAPTVASVSPAPDGIVADERPLFSVTFSEAIDPDSWNNGGLTLTGPDGTAIAGTFAYAPARSTGSFTPTSALVLGSVYRIALGSIRDLAGNPMAAVAPWTVKRLAPGSISITATKTSVVYGESIAFSGSRTPRGPVTVTLRARPAGSTAWRDVVRDDIESDTYRLTASPSASGRYRVEMGATGSAGPAASRSVSIVVKRAVQLNGAEPRVVRTAKARRNVALVAQVAPAVRNLPVTFKLYRRVGSRWVLSTSKTVRTGVSGAAAYTWRPSVGRWAWRISAGGTALLAANTSGYYEYRVSR